MQAAKGEASSANVTNGTEMDCVMAVPWVLSIQWNVTFVHRSQT